MFSFNTLILILIINLYRVVQRRQNRLVQMKFKIDLYIQNTVDLPNLESSILNNLLCAHIHTKFTFFQKYLRK